ncbi:MAG TPA: gluconate 2-dehydrogenase subunit 3 family protein [Solirubrobacterales bacterium]|nr:gluconate 2-dehydrogenase subunit 3 family protein [Solirubrobacterales bacterium]
MSRDPGLLPNLGGTEAGGPPPKLPRQRRGTTPQMRGRYPDYDVLEQTEHWDEETRRVVLDRVERVPSIRFFDEREAATLGAFCDLVLAQDSEPRIPVLAMVDEKLFEGRGEGYRHADMPSDPETWRQVARLLDAAAACEQSAAAASAHRDAGFAAAPAETQLRIVERFSRGDLAWEGMPVAKAWALVMRDTLAAFYSHPWAWNEIGFGGPAYPRGYARLGPGQREHWESPPEFELDPVRDVRERGLE